MRGGNTTRSPAHPTVEQCTVAKRNAFFLEMVTILLRYFAEYQLRCLRLKETYMRRRWAVLTLLLAAAAPPPTTSPEPVFEHFKGTWAVTLKTRHDTTCSADGVTFQDARHDKPIMAEFPLSCAGAAGVAGFVQITITNPGRQDALAHVDAQAAR
ncbi:MAG TPA: hypothetical protein VGF36_05850, partial [Rhodopila sp.]